MNWAEIGTQIITGIIGVLIAGLGTLITVLINKYVKNDKLKTILNSLNETVRNAVSEVYQTYVEALKKDGMFDAEAQKEALNKALIIIIELLDNITLIYEMLEIKFKENLTECNQHTLLKPIIISQLEWFMIYI